MMDHFFRCYKTTFNLENNKCICQENFLFTKQLDLLTPKSFFELCISQGYIQDFEKNWKNSISIRDNNFAKPVKGLLENRLTFLMKIKH